MSVVLYDDALVEKIKKWIVDPNIVVTSPNETNRIFEYRADTSTNEVVTLPLIAIRRMTPVILNRVTKTPMTFRGWKIEADKDNISQLNGIPITINYQLDIYTKEMTHAEEYVRNFVFNLINYPNIQITIPYNNADVEYTCMITVNEELEDNSDIPERLMPGQFTRKTISFAINNAYLFDYNTKKTLTATSNLEVHLEPLLIDVIQE